MTQDLWSTAERLRAVQSARRRFMTLWAIDQARNLLQKQWDRKTVETVELPEADLSPPNWKALYRGSILDD